MVSSRVAVHPICHGVANTHTIVSDIHRDVSNTRITASDSRDSVTNTHAIVADVFRDVVNPHDIVSELRYNVINTHIDLTDIYHARSESREGSDDKNWSVSTLYTSLIIRLILIAGHEASTTEGTGEPFRVIDYGRRIYRYRREKLEHSTGQGSFQFR